MLAPFRVSNAFYLTLICELLHVVLTVIVLNLLNCKINASRNPIQCFWASFKTSSVRRGFWNNRLPTGVSVSQHHISELRRLKSIILYFNQTNEVETHDMNSTKLNTILRYWMMTVSCSSFAVSNSVSFDFSFIRRVWRLIVLSSGLHAEERRDGHSSLGALVAVRCSMFVTLVQVCSLPMNVLE